MTNKIIKQWGIFFLVALAIFVLDIGTKHWAFEHFEAVVLDPQEEVPPVGYQRIGKLLFVPIDYKPLAVIPNLFNLRVVLNLGAVWGSFHGFVLTLTLFSFVAIFFILYLLHKSEYQVKYQVFLACILGGALGNLWDRIFFGGVRDFLDFYIGKYHWPTFNFADSFILIGIAGYILIEIQAEIASKKQNS